MMGLAVPVYGNDDLIWRNPNITCNGVSGDQDRSGVDARL